MRLRGDRYRIEDLRQILLFGTVFRLISCSARFLVNASQTGRRQDRGGAVQSNKCTNFLFSPGLTQLRNELAQLTRDGLLASLFDASNITRKPQTVAILQDNGRMRGKVLAIWTRTKYKGLWDVSLNLVHTTVFPEFGISTTMPAENFL